MHASRPLQVLLLLTLGVTAVSAKEPGVVYGAGTLTCKVYMDMVREPRREHQADLMFSWVQGFFSARNLRDFDHPLTVGGSLSADTLRSMLTDQCREEKDTFLLLGAAMKLYDKLEEKGL